ncbi:MAG: flippase [Pseudomonadota bacterium]
MTSNNFPRDKNKDIDGGNHSQLRAAKNTVLLVMLRITGPLFGVILVLALSRFLGSEGLGRYTLAYTFLFVCGSIAPLGLNGVITREGARDYHALEKILANALSIVTIISIALTAGTLLLTGLLKYDADTHTAIIILSLAIIPASLGTLLDGASMALQRAGQIAIATAVEYVLKVGGGIILLVLGYGLNAVLLLIVISRTAACVVQVVLLRRAKVMVGWGWDRSTLRFLIHLAPAFLGISIFATLYWRIDVLMLSQMQPVKDVGYYGAAYRILELAMVLPQSLCASLYPQIATAVQGDLRTLRIIGNTALRYLIALSLPTAVCASLLAKPGLLILYGPGFDAAATTLSVLIFTLIPYGVVRYHSYLLVGANRQRVDFILNVVMSVVNVLLNLVLIPHYSHLGTALATLIAICVYAILQYWYLHRFLPGHGATISLQPSVVIVTALTGACVWFLRDKELMLTIAVGAGVYLIGLLVAGFFTRAELSLFKLDKILAKWGILRT